MQGMQLKLFHRVALGYTVDGTQVRQIPERCEIRFYPSVPDSECHSCNLANKVHWCDPDGNKYCTRDILSQKAFEFDLKKWMKY